MKKVITYGTFDLLHYGHHRFLKRAKDLGDFLIVALSSDTFNEQDKGKKTYYPCEIRKEMLSSIKYIDEIIIEDNWEQKLDDIKKHNVDIFVIGDDWIGEFDYLKDYCEVIYLPRTENISSTMLRDYLMYK